MCPLPKGVPVFIYKGTTLSKNEYNSLEYCCYTIETCFSKSNYAIQGEKSLFNYGAMVNHATLTQCNLKPRSVQFRKRKYIMFFTTKKVCSHTELTWCYARPTRAELVTFPFLDS